jgi:asparagine synthase (glutamine-hydrolysing)
MCGIVGIAGWSADALVRDMATSLVHRGPDGEGFALGDTVSLGARRLSVIDVAGSSQPIWNETASVVTVFNGEIYNYRALRAVLESRGHRFRTGGDTEVLVHLYEEYGAAGVHALRGMFAYAVWDLDRRTLVLARDRLGIKPLYYAERGGRLTFASELKAILRDPDVDRRLDLEALRLYVALGYVPGARTMVRGVRRLPPGHLLVWRHGRASLQRYWDLVLEEGERRLNERTAAEEFRALAEESVALHRVSDVPLGVLLSGGIDSAALTGMLARQVRAVQTFTVGFAAYPEDSEMAEARQVARHFGTEHHEVLVGEEIASTLSDIVWAQDEPVADPAAIPTYFVCRFASRRVKVVLTGEGGDELLGGYPRYRWLRLGERMRGWMAATGVAPGVMDGLRTTFEGRRVPSRLLALLGAAPLVDRHLAWVSPMSEPLLAGLFHSEVGSHGWAAAREFLTALLAQGERGNPVHDLMYLDFAAWLPDDVLTKADRMSMAWSVEARVPFLDHRLVEFCASLPAGVKVHRLGTKALLRRTLAGWPASTLARPKRAFLVPLDQWLRVELRELVADTLLAPTADVQAFTDRRALRALVEEQQTARGLHARGLWTLLVLELWLKGLGHAGAGCLR